MKKMLFVFIALFSLTAMEAQDMYKEGYYIDVQGNKVFGLIDDERWLDPPLTINFKVSNSETSKKISISEMLLFSIGEVTYERFTFLIDKKPLRILNEENSTNGQADFTTITAFVKVIVKGKASLYAINYNGDYKFFFKNDESQSLSQLIYREYVTSNGSSKKNRDFQKQLYNNVNCNSGTVDDYLKIEYSEKSLISIFSEYNKCMNANFTVIKEEKNPLVIKITPFVGMSIISHKIGATHEYTTFAGESVSAPKFGTDISIVLPYHHERYEFFARLSYEKFHVDNYSGRYAPSSTSYIIDHIATDCSFIQFGIGPRYNMSLGQKSKFYFEANFGLAFGSGKAIYSIERHNSLGIQVIETARVPMRSAFFGAVGFGYVFNRKIGINLSADLLGKDLITPSNHIVTSTTKSFSATLRYTVN